MISIPHDPELIELCEALAVAHTDGGPTPRPIRHPLLDDALPPRIRRYRAITVRTTDENGNLPLVPHPRGPPERVDPDALARATEFVTSLARLLDRDTGRRV